MPHFLIQSNSIQNDLINVYDIDLLKHFVTLRIQKGENIKFIDENEIQYFCETLSISKKEGSFKILEQEKSKRKLNFELYLAQSILKTDAQNLAIDNAVQLGVKGIYPILSDNCAVKESVAREKVEKWKKISKESFKQCERADLAEIYDVEKMEDVLEKFENIIIFTEKNNNITLSDAIKKLDKNKKILVVIGPEGGFSNREFEYFKKKNYMCPTLGNLILKAPNAISAGLSNIIWGLDEK